MEDKSRMNRLKIDERVLHKKVLETKKMLEIENLKAQFNVNADQEVKPNPQFSNFTDLFTGLLNSKNVKTHFPIISCILTNDVKFAICV